jgi:hypothetical protein
MDPALVSLLTYFRPLATLHRTWPDGSAALLSPGVNLLGANAAYLEQELDWDAAQAWAAPERWPLLRARLDTGNAQAEIVGTLHVGTFQATASESPLQVEQISRLNLPTWAGVLAEAHGQPEWAPFLARHLATRLEGVRDCALLLAYAGAEPVGALLWQPSGVHLWGTLDEAVDAPLLHAAAELSGGELLVSLLDSSPVGVVNEVGVRFELE